MYVETLDRSFESVCELDLIFNSPKASAAAPQTAALARAEGPALRCAIICYRHGHICTPAARRSVVTAMQAAMCTCTPT